MAREKELFRAKEEDFQELLDYKKSIKGKLGGGFTTIRHDYEAGEYVLVHIDKNWTAHIIESAAKMSGILEGLEDYIAKEVRA